MILIFIYYKYYITAFDKGLSIHLWCFFFFNFGGILEFIYIKKYHIFYVNNAYFCFIYLFIFLLH